MSNEETPIFDGIQKNYEKPEPILGPITPVENENNGKPEPKVIAATIGASVGAAVAQIGVWLAEISTGVDIPTEIEGSFTVVVTALLAFVSGYFKRN